MGFDNGWRNVWWELAYALSAVLMIGAIWAAGWFVNRPWSRLLRWTAALGAGALASGVDGMNRRDR
jgi:peptidoglycan biosynthesis protein MviN/MurJ (putative lipid II flippase)